jgi:hypothetical protein
VINPNDDFFLHPAGSDDPGWFDRFYMNIHSPNEALTISHGTGTYPQVGVIDGFSMLAGVGPQRNVRASIESRPTRTVAEAGPLRAEIVEPLKRWRIQLDENDQGFSYDLEFEGDLAPIDAGRMNQRSKKTGALVDFSHFVQVGRIKGRLTIDGKARDLDGKSWLGLRDRSWGVRPRVGAAPLGEQGDPQYGRHDWVLGRIGDRAVFYILAGGSPTRAPYLLGAGLSGPDGEIKVSSVERKTEWDANGRFKGAKATLKTESGETVELEVKSPSASLYLRGGLYGGLNGIHQGEPRGGLVCETDRWATNDPAVLAEVAGLNDHICKLESKTGSGFGIYEVAAGT